MTITIEIPSVLRSCCEGAGEITLSAQSIRGALDQIERLHPSLYRSVCDETRSIRPHINLFLNSSLVSDVQGFEATLTAGDVISIYQAVSGG